MMDWSKYEPYFFKHEFRCSHTGKCDMRPEFMDKLLAMRIERDKPMVITSGYRHVTHPEEVGKSTTGAHPKGWAADIRVYSGTDRMELIQLALKHGCRRIGVANTFIHLDFDPDLPQDVVWTY